MIDVARVRYDLAAVTPQGSTQHLGDALRGLSWEEQPDELAVRLQAEIANRKLGSTWLHRLLPLGGWVVLRADWGVGWHEVFSGVVFDWGYSTDPPGRLSITAYDPLIYLTKSRDDRYYPSGTSARAILVDVARAWRIPLGTIEGPDVALSKQVFRAQRLGDIVASVLDQAEKRGAGRFVVRHHAGKLEVVRPGQNNPVYHFDATDAVERVEDRQDVESLVTRVKVVGAEDGAGRAPVVARVDGDTEFGVLQELVYQEQYDTPAAAASAAREVLKERGAPRKRRTLTAPDLPFLRRGDKVHIAAGTLLGYYLVAGVQHDADSRTMHLEVEDLAG